MAELLTLKQIEVLAMQLPRQEQLELVAKISSELSRSSHLTQEKDETQLQHARHSRAEAILALCDAAAERFEGESDAAEDIRQMRDERIEQICQSNYPIIRDFNGV